MRALDRNARLHYDIKVDLVPDAENALRRGGHLFVIDSKIFSKSSPGLVQQEQMNFWWILTVVRKTRPPVTARLTKQTNKHGQGRFEVLDGLGCCNQLTVLNCFGSITSSGNFPRFFPRSCSPLLNIVYDDCSPILVSRWLEYVLVWHLVVVVSALQPFCCVPEIDWLCWQPLLWLLCYLFFSCSYNARALSTWRLCVSQVIGWWIAWGYLRFRQF